MVGNKANKVRYKRFGEPLVLGNKANEVRYKRFGEALVVGNRANIVRVYMAQIELCHFIIVK
ncbi:hypothetical protein XK27_04495 [Streptococcus suis]|nr:hypothetical protein A7J10_03100 [Streptococcus suis]KPA67645.1 hypothetical protein XK27_04495 [Streptococcus suis]